MLNEPCKLTILATLAVGLLALDASAQGSRPAAPKAALPRAGTPAPATAARPPASGNANMVANGPEMKQLLKIWEQRSSQLKSLDVQIKRVDKSPAWSSDEQYIGRAILKAPDLAWLDFNKVKKNESDEVVKDAKGNPLTEPYDRIICTGKEVWQYKSDTRQVFIFPLDKKNQQSALEEGPLPFLFNMRAAEAEARYGMTIVNNTPEAYIISIVPKLKLDQESFSKAFLQLSKKTFLPDRIVLISPNGKDSKDFYLTRAVPNADWKGIDDNFVGKPLGKPWTMVRNPGADAPSAPAGVSNRPAAKAANRTR